MLDFPNPYNGLLSLCCRVVRLVGRCSAKVAELVDALDLGSSGVTRESSSLSFRTKNNFPGGRRDRVADYAADLTIVDFRSRK